MGRLQAALKKEGKCLVWGVIVFSIYFAALVNYFKIEQSRNVSVYLCDNFPSVEQAQEILEKERESEEKTEMCFLYQGGFVSVEEETYKRQAEVYAAGIQGNTQLYDHRALGFSWDDENGCLLDTETAEKLFGSGLAVGREVIMGGNTYKVRGVIPWKQPLILYHPKGQEIFYTKMLVQEREKNSVQEQVNYLLAKYGLNGMIMEEGGEKTVALLLLAPFPATMFGCFILLGRKEQKRHGKKELVYWAWEGMFAVVLLGGALFVWKQIQVPSGWIPGKWSDFAFFSDKLEELTMQVRLYLLLPKTPVQAENIIYFCKCLAESILAFFLFLMKFLRQGINPC